MDASIRVSVLGGRYRLDHLLGRGGMGAVWAGHDTLLDRPVAVKMLRDDAGAEMPVLRERLLAEARAAAGVHHPNLVATFDAGYDEGTFALVMERLPGRSLADRLAEGPLSDDEARAVAADVLAGLEAVHRSGLVHRDVKPANVLQAADGRWKVVDFGIAKSLHGGDDLTLTGTTIGTPAYLAPEQLAGARATPRSDLWAVGVMLYEALAGTRPFSGDTPFATADAVRNTDPLPLSVVRPGVDPALAAAVDRALRKTPEDRFPSAAAMAAALSGPPGAVMAPTAAMPVAAMAPSPDVAGTPTAPLSGQTTTAKGATGDRRRRRAPVGPLLAALLVLTVLGAVALGRMFWGDDSSSSGDAGETPATSTPATSSPAEGPTSAPSTAPSPTAAEPPAPAPSQPAATVPPAAEPGDGGGDAVDGGGGAGEAGDQKEQDEKAEGDDKDDDKDDEKDDDKDAGGDQQGEDKPEADDKGEQGDKMSRGTAADAASPGRWTTARPTPAPGPGAGEGIDDR